MAFVDLYCERVGPGLLAEPANALTNAAFLVAAFAAWRLAAREDKFGGGVAALVVVIALIGVASALFHTAATAFTRALDASAIAVYGLIYVWLHLRRIAGLAAAPTGAVLAGLVVAGAAARGFPDLLNGTLIYAPMLAAAIALAVLHVRHAAVRRHGLVVVIAVFAVSLALRIVDNDVCAAFPLGTHFGWHLLNAVALFLATRALIDNLPCGEPRAAPGTDVKESALDMPRQ